MVLESIQEIAAILSLLDQGATALARGVKEDRLADSIIQIEAAKIFLRQTLARLDALDAK